jgi:hypothetical protein
MTTKTGSVDSYGGLWGSFWGGFGKFCGRFGALGSPVGRSEANLPRGSPDGGSGGDVYIHPPEGGWWVREAQKSRGTLNL